MAAVGMSDQVYQEAKQGHIYSTRPRKASHGWGSAAVQNQRLNFGDVFIGWKIGPLELREFYVT
jgi:hypothetical protein